MKAFFEGIQSLFELILAPYDYLRALELECWFGANTINAIFMVICASAILYWIKQLKNHKDEGQDNQDTTAHSFLG